jgi:hypothetical protein
MKKPILVLFSLLFTFSVFAQERGFYKQRIEAKDHVALIIGNSAYPDAALVNPKNDAIAVAKNP